MCQSAAGENLVSNKQISGTRPPRRLGYNPVGLLDWVDWYIVDTDGVTDGYYDSGWN